MEIMEAVFQVGLEWFLSLWTNYWVNPRIFGAIYVWAIPLFAYFSTRVVSNARNNHSIVLPALGAGVCFVSAYIYLIIAGENVPVRVYGFIVVLVLWWARSAYTKITKQIHE